MDTLLRSETLSGQLADVVERKIRRGELAPGFKLPTFRELEDMYKVTFQVVKSAVTILERKGLVICKPRVGIYVNPATFIPTRKNLALLHSVTRCKQDYSEVLLAFGTPGLWEAHAFTKYQLPVGVETSPGLAYEIERVAATNPDCLLVSLPAVRRQDLALFRNRGFPVVFLGDFSGGVFPEAENNLVEDTGARARAFVEKACRQGLRDVAFVSKGQPETQYYIRLLVEAGEAKAREFGMRFRYLNVDESGCDSDEDYVVRRASALAPLLADGAPDGFLMESIARTDLFVEALRRSRLPEPERTRIITSFEMYPGTTYVEYDYAACGAAAKLLLDGLIENPWRPLGRRMLTGRVTARFLDVS